MHLIAKPSAGGNLLLCLLHRMRGNDLRHGLAGYRTGQGPAWSMAGIPRLGTSAACLAAAPIPRHKRSWPHIARRRQSGLQFCSPLLKLLNGFLLHQFTSVRPLIQLSDRDANPTLLLLPIFLTCARQAAAPWHGNGPAGYNKELHGTMETMAGRGEIGPGPALGKVGAGAGYRHESPQSAA